MTSAWEARSFRTRTSRQVFKKLLLLLIAVIGSNQAWQCLSQGESTQQHVLSHDLERLSQQLRSDSSADRISAASELGALHQRCSGLLLELSNRSFAINGRPPEPELTRLMTRFRSSETLDLCVENCDAVVASNSGTRFDAFDRYEYSKVLLAYGGSSVPAIYRFLRSHPVEKVSESKIVLLSAVLREVYGREMSGEKNRIEELMRSLNLEAMTEGQSTSAKRNFERALAAVREKRSVFSLK